ncbi:MAG TPA: MSMEG_4193 family putative phosphomutase [Anaerolineae bacterium]|nr:MSMEG_4193 family putative phosphomutase [Anaerolineae bacterium]
MARILLVRHGQNDWVSKHRLAGWIEGVHLNDVGKKQAKAVAERLAELPLVAIYSSPVTRCVETATYIAKHHDVRLQEVMGMGEVRYGEWEGEKIAELAKLKEWYAVQHFPSRFRFPGGESFLEVQSRAVAALEAISEAHEAHEMVVVCSHADVIKLVIAYYLGAHMDLFQRIGLAPTAVSIIDLGPNGRVRIERVNDTGPIPILKPPTPAKDDKSEKKKKKKKKKKEKKDK